MNSLARQIARLHDCGIAVCFASGRGTAVLRYAFFLAKTGSVASFVIRWNGLEGLSVPSRTVLFRLSPFTSGQLTDIEATLDDMELEAETLKREVVRLRMRDPSAVMRVVTELRRRLKDVAPGALCTWNRNVADISPPGCDKALAVRRLFPRVGRGSVLAIGDSCSRYGNDHLLLRSFPSYCVGNHDAAKHVGRPVIGPHGQRLTGSSATLQVLKDIRCQNPRVL